MANPRRSERNKNVLIIEDSPLATFLFQDVRFSWFWLVIRLYVGYEWLMAGLNKINSPKWTGSEAGAALTGFIKGALAKTAGDHPDVQGWYAWFLENAVLPAAPIWSWAVVIGEILVGVGLIVGLFTGIAAFFGGFMNVNYLLAGTVSSNPFLFVFATWLVLAWKTAGWLGLDRWALMALGTPWRPGRVFQKNKAAAPEA